MAGSERSGIGVAETRLSRRRLLGAGAAGAAGLALSGGLAELLTGALGASGPAPPGVPRWHSRPDLRIPTLTVLRDDPAASRHPIFIAPYNAPGGAQAGAVIVDARGDAIWENPLADTVTTNFRVQSYRGHPVLTWWEGSIELGHGVGRYVIADSAYRPIRHVQAARGLRGDLHEFVITPHDTALLTSYVVKHADLSSVGGPRDGTIQDAIFQEIDLASGRPLLEWHSLDHIPLSESYAPVSADWDFFHINSVDLDGDGNLLISGRSTHTIYKIDRRDGAVLWRLGGRYGDFAMGPGTQFAWQHDARRRADGTLSVFDNGATPAVEPRSRALIVAVDEQAMTAGLVHQYSHPGVLAGSQGSVQLLDSGNVFVGWGEVPRVSEFARDGSLLFDALLGRQYESYRAFRLPWTGRPAEAPAIALARGWRGAPVAYASWNGATDVHAWQLLAGAGGRDLQPLLQVAATGFETSLPAPPRAGPAFAVRALDAAGGTLGQSRIVAT